MMTCSSLSVLLSGHYVLAGMYAVMGLYADAMLEPQVSLEMLRKAFARPT